MILNIIKNFINRIHQVYLKDKLFIPTKIELLLDFIVLKNIFLL